MRFFVDWVVSEVKKLFAEVVNVIVKVLTFGLEKDHKLPDTAVRYTSVTHRLCNF